MRSNFKARAVACVTAIALTIAFAQPSLPQPLIESRVVAQRLDEITRTLREPAAQEAAVRDFARTLPGAVYVDPATVRAQQRAPACIGIGVPNDVNALATRGLISVQLGSPAYNAGVRVGDVIERVNQQAVEERTPLALLSAVCGADGSTVTLTVRRGERRFDVTVTRRLPINDSFSTVLLPNGVGYIGVRASASSLQALPYELGAEINRLQRQGARRFILDVRGNASLSVQDGANLADVFLREGVITRVYDVNGEWTPSSLQTEAKNGMFDVDAPLVVLVNEGTENGGEVLAAALQAHGRARAVGARTAGNGVMFFPFRTPEGGWLSVPVRAWFTPSGRSVHGVGVTPDVIVPSDAGVFPDKPDVVLDASLAAALALLARTP
ncbi:S41 family peptidase [Deinococcus yavapaiensis]|uniref:Carboxyl-terminal processing protease n=1 Tax=Deinococcus yavapaiensis KR-236 TaxID=694435 RepID=A0A318S285_9DEIO|nr:S41 family peptidase [Deinococcus yavapaiensis]PYE49489.1 carboxyl-terminal processing protease [Deinococcus yavapaiensis KR-236]